MTPKLNYLALVSLRDAVGSAIRSNESRLKNPVDTKSLSDVSKAYFAAQEAEAAEAISQLRGLYERLDIATFSDVVARRSAQSQETQQ